jgi:uncharacterized metal-binding protein
MIRIEMKVDDVKRSEKGLDSCVLKCAKDESTINGVLADVSLTIKADGVDLFEDMGVPHKGCLIDIEFKDPAQTSLPGK